MNIEVNLQDLYFEQSPITAENWQSWFAVWLKKMNADIPEAKAYELTLRLTDDREIHSLNQQYRQIDKPTDVLAFASLEIDMPQLEAELLEFEPLYLGDIIVSVDTAKLQAEQENRHFTTEIIWLAAHGFLHLIGWDHPDEESLVKMLAQQENLLSLINVKIDNSVT